MPSEKRSAAARLNGAKSRGPKTPEGKRKSSCNALRHGFFAGSLLIQGESREDFNISLDQYIRKFEPADDIEHAMVEEMMAAQWRIRRLWNIEAGLLDEAICQPDAAHSSFPLGAAFTRLTENDNRLELIQRYENRLHRMYQRALNNYIKLREFRQTDETPVDRLGAVAPAPPPAAPQQPETNETNPTEPNPNVAYVTHENGEPVIHLPDVCVQHVPPPPLPLETENSGTNPGPPAIPPITLPLDDDDDDFVIHTLPSGAQIRIPASFPLRSW